MNMLRDAMNMLRDMVMMASWQEPAEQASGQTLRLQLDNLELRFHRIDAAALTPAEKVTHDNIANAFERGLHGGLVGAGSDVSAAPIPIPSTGPDDVSGLTWDDAFRLETQISCLLRGDRLRQEIASRLRWAIADKVPQALELQDGYASLLKAFADNKLEAPDESFRDFLTEVMEAIHWHSKRKHISRKLRGQATRRTLLLAVAALLVALLPYFLLPAIAPPHTSARSLASTNIIVPIAFAGDADSWIHFALYTGLAFGFLGALFSRLITLQTQWSAMALDELYNARSYHYIVLRACIGVVGALVVYFFLQSGLVSGKVFPDFDKLDMRILAPTQAAPRNWPTNLLLPSADLALLIMWSFIAGFSESLVPTVLSNTERQFGSAMSARR